MHVYSQIKQDILDLLNGNTGITSFVLEDINIYNFDFERLLRRDGSLTFPHISLFLDSSSINIQGVKAQESFEEEFFDIVVFVAVDSVDTPQDRRYDVELIMDAVREGLTNQNLHNFASSIIEYTGMKLVYQVEPIIAFGMNFTVKVQLTTGKV